MIAMLDYPEPTVYATPFFIITVVLEALLIARGQFAQGVGKCARRPLGPTGG